MKCFVAYNRSRDEFTFLVEEVGEGFWVDLEEDFIKQYEESRTKFFELHIELFRLYNEQLIKIINAKQG